MLALIGTLLMHEVAVLIVGYVVVLLPLLASTRLLGVHRTLTLKFLGSIAILLVLVWGFLIGAPPGAPRGSAPVEGFLYAARITLRLAIAGGIFQVCIMSIPPDRLAFTLRRWGLRGHGLVIALGGYTLMTEIGLRAEQIVSARFARGLVPARTILHRLKQIPYILRPLTTWVLRSALQRSEVWEQRRMDVLLARAAEVQVAVGSWPASAALVGLGSTWLLIGLLL